MDQNIVLTTELQEKFKTAWAQRQVIFFSAPCGCGKSAAASALLEPYTVCRWDALSEPLEPAHNFTCDAVLLDNLQALKSPDAQQALRALILERLETHFVLLSRGAVPGWLASFRYERRMQVFETQNLMLDQETADKLLSLSGISPTPAEMSAIQKSCKGYPLALGILCHQMQGGRPYDETVDADVRRELFTHFQTAVYRRFKPMTRRLLLDLAPFEPFDVEFARILSGNSRAGEQVLSSPALMAGMSMLSSICMDYDASEAWYLELERCAGRLKRSDADYKSVRGWLAYLDIALPQRSVGDILSKLTNVVSLLSSKEIVMPEFSVTSRLPSIMNGGKDFCAWSREDDDLYRKYRIPVSFLLKRDGVALPECAIAESKFEKGEEISGRMLDLLGRLEKIQKKGTPDIEFALIGLLVRLRIDQGEAERAIEHLEALRERFQRPDCQRFLPNLDALMCRIAMYQGNDEAVDTWYREKAPRDLLKLRVMLRYQYLTRAMVEIVYGKYQEALLVMAPLRPYFKAAHRVMDGIYLDLLTALCQFRSGDGGWQASLRAALDTCRDYQFIRPVSQYGAAILPLLEKGGWTADPAFLDRLTAAARKQAAQYPDFLRFRGDLPEPLSPAEMNVLRLLCHHKSNAEIGEILGIKLPTVKTYVSAVLRKLDVKNRGAVKDAALKLHLI